MGVQYYLRTTLAEPLVARKDWGGESQGVRVQLYAGVQRLHSLDQTIFGDDGSLSSLRELSREAGREGLLHRLRRKRNGQESVR